MSQITAGDLAGFDLQFLFDADTGIYQDADTTPAVADNDPVHRWHDISGNRVLNHLTFGGAAPTLKLAQTPNGSQAVLFGATSFMTFDFEFIWPKVCTIFACLNIAGGATARTILGGRRGSMQYRTDLNGGSIVQSLVQQGVAYVVRSTGPIAAGWGQVGMAWNNEANTARFSSNSAADAAGAVTAAAAMGVTVVGYNTIGSLENLNTAICSLIGIRQYLTAPQMATVAALILAKKGA